MSHLHFDLHGLSVSVAAADRDLRDFVKAHFEAARGDDRDADLQIEGSWSWGAGRTSGAGEPAAGQMERVGRGLLMGRGGGDADALRAVWRRVPGFPELTMTFELPAGRGGRLKVAARCAYTPRGVGKRLEYLRRGRVERKRSRLFFKLMYFMIYYPMAWQLERTRGWGLLHASAVTMPTGRTVLLSGLGGVGKSTLGLSLLSRPGARLLSDNLVFHDEDRIYACPEPVRLDAASVEAMIESGVEPVRTRLPLDAHPKPTWRLSAARRADSGAPAAIFFLRFAPRPGVSEIGAERAAQMLLAGNDLAAEIKDYRPCAAVLSLLAAQGGGDDAPAVARASLTRLLSRTRCALFRIGEGERVADTAGRLARQADQG